MTDYEPKDFPAMRGIMRFTRWPFYAYLIIIIWDYCVNDSSNIQQIFSLEHLHAEKYNEVILLCVYFFFVILCVEEIAFQMSLQVHRVREKTGQLYIDTVWQELTHISIFQHVIITVAVLCASAYGLGAIGHDLEENTKLTSLMVLYMWGLKVGGAAGLTAILKYQHHEAKAIEAEKWAAVERGEYHSKANEQQQETYENEFEQDGQSSDAFGFDSGRFNAGETPAPRGFESRHPDDAKLWAIVDDPAASVGERVNAMDKIAKREAARKPRAIGMG